MTILNNLRYNNYKIVGLPAPTWGAYVPSFHGIQLQCASCGSKNIHRSATPEDPDKILGEMVRCGDCGWMTDWYENYKAGCNG